MPNELYESARRLSEHGLKLSGYVTMIFERLKKPGSFVDRLGEVRERDG